MPLNQQGGALIAPNSPTPTNSGALLNPGQSAFQPIPTVNLGLPPSSTPAPKQQAVVTANAASKDLAAKQTNVNNAAAAMNTQGQIAQAGQVQQTGQPQQGAVGTTQQSSATNASASTKADILNLIAQNPGVTLTQQQLQQIGSMDTKGIKKNADGTYTLDNNARIAVGESNPQSDSVAYASKARAELDAQAQNAYNTFSSQLQQLQNGTFPLTASQQSQMTALQGQFEQLRQQQIVANQNYEGAITTLGIRSGRSRYAPEIESGNIAAAVSYGIGKIAEINNKAAEAVATLQTAFDDKNYKLINTQYAALQDLMKSKQESLAFMQKTVQDELTAQTQRIQNQKALLDLETAQIDNVASASLDIATMEDGSLDYDALQAQADAYGVDMNTLYGAVLKQKEERDAMEREEQKFGMDMETSRLNQQKIRTDISEAPARQRLLNAQAQKAEADAVAAVPDTQSAQNRVNQTLKLAQDLYSPTATGKSAAVGASFQKLLPGASALGLQPDRVAFESRVDTLKANLTLDNLKLLKGPMSDKDLKFLQDIGSSLNTDMSEVEFDKQLENVIAKLSGVELTD